MANLTALKGNAYVIRTFQSKTLDSHCKSETKFLLALNKNEYFLAPLGETYWLFRKTTQVFYCNY